VGPRVVVVDGHPLMRTGQIHTLNAGGMRVVSEFGSGEEAIRLVEQVRPDLVILGLNLVDEMDGIETLVRMKSLPDPPRVLVHAAYNLADDLTSCFLAGADGFLHKSADRQRFLEDARSVAAGRPAWFPGKRAGDPRSLVNTTPVGASLTPREREVLALMLRRYSNAEALYISAQTAKNHASKVLRKLGARNRKELLSRSPISPA
jgi:DNA-binding NarL/FixJ family response regulator